MKQAAACENTDVYWTGLFEQNRYGYSLSAKRALGYPKMQTFICVCSKVVMIVVSVTTNYTEYLQGYNAWNY